MFKYISVWLSCLSLSFLFNPQVVLAQETWEIESFQSYITINNDASVVIEETIAADFGSLQKHGIYRDIPVSYRDDVGQRRDIELEVLSVTDANGEERPYTTSGVGSDVRVRIGDANVFVTGEQVYRVRYKVDWVFNYFGDHDELYWNVTGDAWEVPIRSTQVIVEAPTTPSDIACYTGQYDSTQQDCEIIESGLQTKIAAESILQPNEGLTIVVGLPPGTVTQPTWWQVIARGLAANWGYLIPVVALGLLFRMYWRRGRDHYYVQHYSQQDVAVKPLFATQTIPDTYYPPKDIPPAEAGVIIDERVGNQDIAAVLIGLAEKGYVTIKETGKKKYTFNTTDITDRSALRDYEKVFYDGLFKSGSSVELKDLKYSFASTAQDVKSKLYEQVTKDGYFVYRPDRIRALYLVLGLLIVGLGFFSLGFFESTRLGISPSIGIALSGVLVMVFSFYMPKRTAKGHARLLEVLGLKKVIKLGDYRQQLFEKNNYVTEILPYAIAFGLTKQWAEAVKELQLEQPAWYRGQGTFSAHSFGRSMSALSSSSSSTLTATRSSGAASGSSGFSGGSSGGGFGGGGGGSW